MIVDYRKRSTEHVLILINGAVEEQVESFKFLGVHINNKLEWSKHTKTVMKRAQQSLFPLRNLKRFGMGPEILKSFYNCNIESILTGCITAWYGNCSASRPQGTTEGSAYGPVHHWGKAACHLGPLHQAVSEEGPENCQRPESAQS